MTLMKPKADSEISMATVIKAAGAKPIINLHHISVDEIRIVQKGRGRLLMAGCQKLPGRKLCRPLRNQSVVPVADKCSSAMPFPVKVQKCI